jgi:hypothetical protein
VVVVGTRVVPHRSCFLESGKRVFLVIAYASGLCCCSVYEVVMM